MKALLQPSYSGQLPIHTRREEIIESIRRNQVVVIAGETGSGKTTQIPKFLLELGLGRKGWIGCTQPRRVAALSVAQRIAEELGVGFGDAVGAKIRFTDQTSGNSVIKVMTDGILLNELQDDSLLKNYEAIVIDEAHERSLNIDFILGCLKNLTRHRKDLKIIITSATIDTESFSRAFGHAPVIEVSGRMYPVEVLYRPVGTFGEEDTDIDYLDAANVLVNEIHDHNREGDILVFLPGERDIHELRRLLEKSPAGRSDIIPLFGRMANTDQQRIFHPGGKRRVILSTNIAETSLTVPGIRYVVDTGLARISRYSPHSRTQRLPIEPIAQSSAEQRKGRCGRVNDGTCYRLYSEDDYKSRPPFNTPEIHRSNLASVVLRMMAFRLGDIRTFPFIDPPADNAIIGGYRLLAELGAVSSDDSARDGDTYRLTKLGYRLSRLPVDPTVGRMLLQAEVEKCLDEVLVIASGLSVQDPRERPADSTQEADEMHRKFTHPESDFLTLLNIWNAYHEKLDQLSQSKLRKFCKEHFLSYQRMREWRDIHHQIERLLGKKKEARPATDVPDGSPSDLQVHYAAIHRSILSGLLSNVARKEEGHIYRGPRNRKAMLFPGSGLFDRKAAKKLRNAAHTSKGKSVPVKTSAPDWIVCGEWMETSRLYARTAARVEVEWVEAVAGDLIRVSHTEPFWSTKSAAVLCKERTLLFGLELKRRNVSYSRIEPESATEIFIRNGLIEGGIKERPEFFKHNEDLRERAASEIARLQIGSVYLVEDRLFEFYRRRIKVAGSFAELRREAKSQHNGSLDFLKASLSDLLPEQDQASSQDFPRTVELGGEVLSLSYRNERGHEADGATLHLPLSRLGHLQEGALDWAIPGHLDAKIECLLRNLPKPLRIKLHPLKDRVAELRKHLQPSEEPLTGQLAAVLKDHYGIPTYRSDWKEELPDYLKLRLEVRTESGETLAAGRNLAALRRQVEDDSQAILTDQNFEGIPAWQKAAQQYEREALTRLDFGELPASIDLSQQSGLPLVAFPALVAESGKIHLRLLPEQARARSATEEAWPRLCEQLMGREIAWLQKDLKELKSLGTHLLALGGYDKALGSAWTHLRRYLFASERVLPLDEKVLKQCIDAAKQKQRSLIRQLLERLKTLLENRAQVALLLEKKKTNRAITYPGMKRQLQRLAPENLLEIYDFDDLPHLTRFLRCMVVRAERAKQNIQRDIDKAKRIAPYETNLEQLEALEDAAGRSGQPNHRSIVKPYRMLLEEFKISVFAQELGTAQKVSEKRLDQLAAQIEERLK